MGCWKIFILVFYIYNDSVTFFLLVRMKRKTHTHPLHSLSLGDITNSPSPSFLERGDFVSIFDKTEYVVFVYMLEKFVINKLSKFREKCELNDFVFEQNFFESIQNIVVCINLKLIKSSDII